MTGKINYYKWIKLILGAVVACMIANGFQLQYYTAAGIITLLSIQDTKKETIVITLKRLIIFAIMTGLSCMIYPLIGYNIWAFGLILIPYLFICLSLKMPEAIAPVAVLCTHYLASKSCSFSMIMNELAILVIGAGIGVVLNLFMPDNRNQILKFQKATDDKIIAIIHKMSVYILKEDKSEYTGSCFVELENLLHSLEKEAIMHMKNHMINTEDYFLRYMDMRTMQCVKLKEIYENIVKISYLVEQAEPISQLLECISLEFAEENDVEDLLNRTEKLLNEYRKSDLPNTREEFETRAILFDILGNIKGFLQIKREFMILQKGKMNGK